MAFDTIRGRDILRSVTAVLCMSLIALNSGCRKDPSPLQPLTEPADRPFTVHWDPVLDSSSSIFFSDRTHGWSVGSRGTVLSTADGGISWYPQSSGTKLYLTSVHFVSSSDGWIVGDMGTVLCTKDGGKSWIRQDSGTAEFLTAVYFTSRSHGCAAGRHGTILRTDDGGAHWRLQTSGTFAFLLALSFVSEAQGWVAGSHGTILSTQDGGTTWHEERTGVPNHLQGICFVNPHRGWAVGQAGEIISTHDGGASWRRETTKNYSTLFAVHFTDDEHGWAVGESGTIVSTKDGGRKWDLQESGTEASLGAVYFLDNRHGWAAGAGGALLRTEQGGVPWNSQQGWVTGRLSCVRFADPRVGYAVGEKGAVLTSSDGGATWTPQKFPSKSYLTSVSPVDANHAWVVGVDGLIMSTGDGGRTWKRQKSIPKALAAVYFVDSMRGWVVGEDGLILSTQDGGRNWSQQRSPSARHLTDVCFVSPAIGWAAGIDGIIIHTEDGGLTWQNQYSGSGVSLMCIRFLNPKKGWASGDAGTMLTTNDGGRTWQPQSTGATYDLITQFANENTGWAVSELGTILATTDAGRSWSPQSSPTHSALTSIYMNGARTGCVVGLDGTILVGTPTGLSAYVSAFNSGPSGRFELTEWTVSDDKNSDSVTCRIAFQKDSDSTDTWTPINEPVTSEVQGNHRLWRVKWDPSSLVPDGRTIHFRVTLTDSDGIVYHQVVARNGVPIGYMYRSFWDRTAASWKAVLEVVVGAVLYVIASYLLLLIRPVTFVWLAGQQDKLLALTEKIQAVGPIIGVLIKATLVPYFAVHERTRCKWIVGYRSGVGAPNAITSLAESVRAQFLSCTDVLDAWVERRAALASAGFERLDDVASRPKDLYVPWPVTVSSSGEMITLTEPKPSDLRTYFALSSPDTGLEPDRTLIEILGEGGTGKSTLACQMGRWALAESIENRLGPHRMIPVFLVDETSDICEAVERYIRQVAGTDDLSAEIVMSLMRSKRILVIVDALSERTAAFQTYIRQILGSLPVNALIVTARLKTQFAPARATHIRLQRLQEAGLVFFLNEYVRRRDDEHRLSGELVAQLGVLLMKMVSERGKDLPVTPLLVSLYAGEAIDKIKCGKLLDDLASSVPDVMTNYVRSVNPKSKQAQDWVADDRVISASRILAGVSIEPDFVPRQFYRDDGENRLRECGFAEDADKVITRLVANGILDESDTGGTRVLRFRFDPLSEYLSAMFWIDKLRSDEQQWRDFAATVQRAPGYPVSVDGFLTAMTETIKLRSSVLDLPQCATSLFTTRGRGTRKRA